ncbi:MAG: choice-of-anchor D domain-containing protein [Myxococcales bacterium]|nr:choice-of-anchor D domain-containing protein [Myxococcales bacterium]
MVYPGPRAKGAALLTLLAPAACLAPVESLTAPELALSAPETLDLGWLAPGQPALARLPIENVGTGAVQVDGLSLPEGPGTDVRIDVTLASTILWPGEVVEAVVQVVAGPGAPAELSTPLRVRVAGLPDDDPRLPTTVLLGRVAPSGLVAEPNPLTIGPVLYRDTATGTVAIRNLYTDRPVEVFALNHQAGRARYDEVVTRGSFGPLPSVDGVGRLTTLSPGESIVVPISYTAPDGPGEAKEQATWRVGSCADGRECGLKLVVQGLPDDEAPRVVLQPSGVHFGPTPVGEAVERQLYIRSEGVRPLEISDLTLTGGPEFEAQLPTPTAIPAHAAVQATFRYLPADESLDNATFTFRTNDPLNPEVTVRLSGSGVVLPPCQVLVTPPELDFGAVELLDSVRMEAHVQSTGRERCILFDPQITLDLGTDEGTFILDDSAPRSATLEPGEFVTYAVTFSPSRPGHHSGTLVVRTSDGEQIDIRLRGDTPEGVNLLCTPRRRVEVGSPVPLVATLSSAAEARSYRWQLLAGPMTDGVVAASFSPDANTGPQVELTPQRLGTYLVSAEVETTEGERFRCEIQVDAEGSGLKATLTWDGAGDLDLHLHRGAAAPWFSEADCHFDNLRPVWGRGLAGQGPNPALDRDDTSGDGPELITLAAPELGVPYTLAVSHFERAAGRTAQVHVVCGRTTAAFDMRSRPFRGTDTGNCTGNDFWTLATVVFIAPDECEVQSIDAYRTTRAACAAF